MSKSYRLAASLIILVCVDLAASAEVDQIDDYENTASAFPKKSVSFDEYYEVSQIDRELVAKLKSVFNYKMAQVKDSFFKDFERQRLERLYYLYRQSLNQVADQRGIAYSEKAGWVARLGETISMSAQLVERRSKLTELVGESAINQVDLQIPRIRYSDRIGVKEYQYDPQYIVVP